MKWIIVTVLLTLPLGYPVVLPSFSNAQETLNTPLEVIPPEERGELMKIISQTALKREVTPEGHQRFWEIVDSNKLTKGDVQEIWDRVLGRSCVSQRYMALAILDAFYNKRDTKNPEFKEYEDSLIRFGVLSVDDVKKSDKFIYKIAHGEPVTLEDIFGGTWQEKVFDEELVQSYRDVFEQLDKQYRCLLKLFDRKCKGYQ